MKTKSITLILLIISLFLIFYLKHSINDEAVSRGLGFQLDTVENKEVSHRIIESDVIASADLPAVIKDQIKQCPPYDYNLIHVEALKEINPETKFVELLEAEPSEESRLIEILHMSNKKGLDLVETLKQFIKEKPNNALARWNLLIRCYSWSEKICTDDEVMELVEKEKDNAAAWLVMASFQLKRGDEKAAFRSLKASEMAQLFKEYRRESFELLEIGLPKGLTQRERNITILGMISSSPTSNLSEIASLCRKSNALETSLSHVCLRAGERLLEDAEMLSTKKYGEAIYRFAHKGIDYNKFKELNATKKQEDRELLISPVHNLMLYDEKLLDLYVQFFKFYGEEKSISLIESEAINLFSNPNYNPCP
ncbi:hypothetical protein FLL45_20260 [Aliikangiella marina]|uniref:Uncharacterized protein n=1 Tax=Aliikangiella marina TaxID=1712262 RepID=A0A545T2Q3_9GAMM|nr:hypothetical protein [Aliikangiella marina]TQV71490.1 hypothetical protein FLL45_20260 [Aliikangiella marina]